MWKDRVLKMESLNKETKSYRGTQPSFCCPVWWPAGWSPWTWSRWSVWLWLCCWLSSTSSLNKWRWSPPCRWRTPSPFLPPPWPLGGPLRLAAGRRCVCPSPWSPPSLYPSQSQPVGLKEVCPFGQTAGCGCEDRQTSSTITYPPLLYLPDEVIRPLIAPAVDPQPKAAFVLGQGEEDLKPFIEEPSIPMKARGLEECVAILKNPEVRRFTPRAATPCCLT